MLICNVHQIGLSLDAGLWSVHRGSHLQSGTIIHYGYVLDICIGRVTVYEIYLD